MSFEIDEKEVGRKRRSRKNLERALGKKLIDDTNEEFFAKGKKKGQPYKRKNKGHFDALVTNWGKQHYAWP